MNTYTKDARGMGAGADRWNGCQAAGVDRRDGNPARFATRVRWRDRLLSSAGESDGGFGALVRMPKMSHPKFILPAWLSDDGEPVELPAKFEVCHRCEGTGVHDHPAFSI